VYSEPSDHIRSHAVQTLEALMLPHVRVHMTMYERTADWMRARRGAYELQRLASLPTGSFAIAPALGLPT